MKKAEVKLKRTADAESIAQILDDLAKSLRDGLICVENGPDFVTLETGEDVQFDLELQAAQKKNKQKFEMELSWKTAQPRIDEDGAFKISSKEPEITEPSPLEEAEPEEREES